MRLCFYFIFLFLFMKTIEEEIHERMRKKFSPCKNGESIDFMKVSDAHGGCTGVDAETLQDPVLNRYNMLYLYYCRDGALAYVCSVCRLCFSSLESAIEHFKKEHGLK